MFFKKKNTQKTPQNQKQALVNYVVIIVITHMLIISSDALKNHGLIRTLKYEGAFCGCQNPSPSVNMFAVPTLG